MRIRMNCQPGENGTPGSGIQIQTDTFLASSERFADDRIRRLPSTCISLDFHSSGRERYQLTTYCRLSASDMLPPY